MKKKLIQYNKNLNFHLNTLSYVFVQSSCLTHLICTKSFSTILYNCLNFEMVSLIVQLFQSCKYVEKSIPISHGFLCIGIHIYAPGEAQYQLHNELNSEPVCSVFGVSSFMMMKD